MEEWETINSAAEGDDLPPGPIVYQQMRRWMDARYVERMDEDPRSVLREFAGRKSQTRVMVLDSRTLRSTPESGASGLLQGQVP